VRIFFGINEFETRNTLSGVKLTSQNLLLILARRGKSGMLPSSNVNTEAKYLLKVLACEALSVIRFAELSLIGRTDLRPDIFPLTYRLNFPKLSDCTGAFSKSD